MRASGKRTDNVREVVGLSSNQLTIAPLNLPWLGEGHHKPFQLTGIWHQGGEALTRKSMFRWVLWRVHQLFCPVFPLLLPRVIRLHRSEKFTFMCRFPPYWSFSAFPALQGACQRNPCRDCRLGNSLLGRWLHAYSHRWPPHATSSLPRISEELISFT